MFFFFMCRFPFSVLAPNQDRASRPRGKLLPTSHNSRPSGRTKGNVLYVFADQLPMFRIESLKPFAHGLALDSRITVPFLVRSAC